MSQVYNLFSGVTVASTVNSTHYETPENHIVDSIQIVIGNSATVKVQAGNEQSPTNWNDLNSGSTSTVMLNVGKYYRHMRASVTAYSTGDVNVHVGYKRDS